MPLSPKQQAKENEKNRQAHQQKVEKQRAERAQARNGNKSWFS
jgi:hypothetical protein